MAEGDLSFKVVVVGESGVGKTSIVNQFSGDTEQVSTGGLVLNFSSFFLRYIYLFMLNIFSIVPP